MTNFIQKIITFSLVCATALFILHISLDNKSTFRPNLQSLSIRYQNITGLIRANFTALAISGDTIVGGDLAGSLSVFQYDSKRTSLIFKGIDRKAEPVLVTVNHMVEVQMLSNNSVISLSSDGKIKSSALSPAYQFLKQSVFDLPQAIKSFYPINERYLLAIASNGHALHLYKSAHLINTPNPITLIANVSTPDSYQKVTFSPTSSLVATGSNKSVLIYKFADQTLKLLFQVNLPKSVEENFALKFTSAETLIVTNGLWISSITFDLSVPSGKILSSSRIQKIVAKGESDEVSVFEPAKGNAVVLTNGRNKGEVYTLSNSKLTYTNDSTDLGKIDNFQLISLKEFIRTNAINIEIDSFQQSTDQKYFQTLKSAYIDSNNHFEKVNFIKCYQNTVVSVSEGGNNNFKLWKLNNLFDFELVDQKTFTFFQVLKSGYVNLKNIAFLPPLKNQNSAKNQTLHILTAGSDPFNIILVTLAATGKIGEIFKTAEDHSGNITFLFPSNSQKYVFSGSKDTLIFVWTLDSERKTLNKSQLISTKSGPISFGLIDKSSTFIFAAHDNTLTSKLANITLWKFDEKSQKLSKVAQNVGGEAHESNISGFIFSKDEKFLISLSQIGELRLWRHQNFTMVDLVATLSLGVLKAKMILTEKGRILIESDTSFMLYDLDQNGFLFNSKMANSIPISSTSAIVNKDILLEGGVDGAIRMYLYSQ